MLVLTEDDVKGHYDKLKDMIMIPRRGELLIIHERTAIPVRKILGWGRMKNNKVTKEHEELMKEKRRKF